MMAQVWGRNLSPRNKHIHKIVLVVTGDFLDLYIFKPWNVIIAQDEECLYHDFDLHVAEHEIQRSLRNNYSLSRR